MNLKSQISNLKWLWLWLREMSGDAAYEHYLASVRRSETHGRCPRHSQPLSRQEFYLEHLQRRYAGVNRCC